MRYTLKNGILYGYDGTVPVIFASSFDSIGIPLTERSVNQVFFDELLPLSFSEYLLRVEDHASNRTSIAALSVHDKTSLRINNEALTKKSDGGFDADGKIIYDEELDEIYYLFYYRNSILKLNKAGEVMKQMKTIDPYTTSVINTITLKDGSKKLRSPPTFVNKEMFVYQGLLFNRSNIIGKFESRAMWKKNSIVDVYITSHGGYWGSIYVQDHGKNKMSQMLITDEYFHVLSGNEIIRYRFAQALTKNFIKGRSRKPQTE